MESNNKFLMANGPVVPNEPVVPMFNGRIKEYGGPVNPVIPSEFGAQKACATKSSELSSTLPIDSTRQPALPVGPEEPDGPNNP